MKIVIIDGQGGKMGQSVIAQLKKSPFPVFQSLPSGPILLPLLPC